MSGVDNGHLLKSNHVEIKKAWYNFENTFQFYAWLHIDSTIVHWYKFWKAELIIL